MTATMDAAAADTAAVGTDASSLITQVLADYGLQSLGDWAWQEITSGASSAQILLNMYQTPEFKQRFPAIALRQAQGLPAISPAEYVDYESSLAQMESQYGMPKGSLTSPDVATEFIGNDVSTNEVQARVQQGFQAVAYAPPEVRQAFAGMFGVTGDGALAHYFLDEKRALPLLEQQATAAQIGGTTGAGGINISTDDAMRLASMGVSQSQATSATSDLDKQAQLYQASVTEQPNLEIGKQGVESAFGLSQAATQQVQQRQQSREAAFSGGGQAYSDQHGVEGAGSAKPI